jgi:hypothetical protein
MARGIFFRLRDPDHHWRERPQHSRDVHRGEIRNHDARLRMYHFNPRPGCSVVRVFKAPTGLSWFATGAGWIVCALIDAVDEYAVVRGLLPGVLARVREPMGAVGRPKTPETERNQINGHYQ